MSAIQSLFRVMTLRDAEAIVLEAGKVPSLRRRGQVEALAMPPLEAQLLSDFAAPLVEGRTVDEWPAIVPVTVDDTSYQVTIEKVPAGLRIVVRKGKPIAAAPKSVAAPAASADTTSRAWWAAPGAARAAPAASHATPGAAASQVGSHAGAPAGSDAGPPPGTYAPSPSVAEDAAHAREVALGRLAQLLGPAVAVARDRGASDVIASTGQNVRVRVDGQFEVLDLAVDDGELAACVTALGSNTDHSLELQGTRVRLNLFDHLAGAGAAVRLIRDRVPSLAELGLPPELGHVIDHRDGLVLVCGTTGSGKSTTLAALIALLDQKRPAHVITLEDPIEYRFAPQRCLIHQREIGSHIPSFAVGLKAALREAPDVIVVGELRDRDTIAAALTAAETGHLVLATLHAPNAAGAIDRMIDAFPDGQQRQARWQLAGVLRTVVTQYLLPRRDGGRAVAIELVPVTNAVSNIMRKGDLHTLPTAINTGRDAGMIPLERTLAKLLDSGAVAPNVVKKIAADHDLLHALSTKLR